VSVPKSITNDFWVKLFSLALATLIWLTVKFAISNNINPAAGPATQAVSRTFARVPVTVMRSAADVRNFQMIPGEVSLTLTGPPEILDRLTAQNIDVFINMTDVHDTAGLVKKVQAHVPPEVTVTRMEPPAVRIERISPTNQQ